MAFLKNISIRQRLFILSGVMFIMISIMGAASTGFVTYTALKDHKESEVLNSFYLNQLQFFTAVREGDIAKASALEAELEVIMAEDEVLKERLSTYLKVRSEAEASGKLVEKLHELQDDLIVAVEEKNKATWEDTKSFLIWMYVGGTIVFAFVAVIAFFVSFTTIRHISKSLNALDEQMENLASQDANLKTRLDVKYGDEIGKISTNFNTFIETIHQLISGMSSTVHKASQSGGTIGRECEEINGVLDTQMASMNEINQAVSDTSAQIQDVNEMTQGNREIANIINNESHESQRVMKNLLENSQQISGVVEVIDGISDEVNLLALNAAIEAARAGEAGLGFAVVADEVRKLAGSTSKSTAEITDVVKRLQNDINEAMEASNRITNSIESMNEKVDLVTDAVQQQSSAMEEISSTVNSFSSQVESASGSVQEVTQTMGGLVEDVDSLETSLSKFKV